MLFSEELTQIHEKRENEFREKSPISQVSNLIETQFPGLTNSLPEAYKSELRSWVSKGDKRYEHLNGKNVVHLLTDKENLHGDLASANDDDAKVEVDLKMSSHLFRKLRYNFNTLDLADMLIFNTTYHSYPVKVLISDNYTLCSNTYNAIIEFPIYAFKPCLEKEGFELIKKETMENGTKYDLIW